MDYHELSQRKGGGHKRHGVIEGGGGELLAWMS